MRGKTWAFDPPARRLVDLEPSDSPPLHQPVALAFDESAGKLVAFGNVPAGPEFARSATWLYDPEKTPGLTPHRPSLRRP